MPRHPERFDAVAKATRCFATSLATPNPLLGKTPGRARGCSDRMLRSANPRSSIPLASSALVGHRKSPLSAAVSARAAARTCSNPLRTAPLSRSAPIRGTFAISSPLYCCRRSRRCERCNTLESFVERCLEDPEFAAELGHRARALVQSNLGATAARLHSGQLLRDEPEAASAMRRSNNRRNLQCRYRGTDSRPLLLRAARCL